MGIVWFQAVLILVVIAHPFRDNIVEWFHRWSYVGGSVLVGWVIATSGRTKQAFRLFLAGSSILALIAMEHAVTAHFQPAQWGVYQKNGIGAIMWIAIVVAQINPPWTGIGRTEARVNKYLCIGGLLASQSRQSVILLILAIGLAVLEPRAPRQVQALDAGRRSRSIVALYFSFTIAARNNPQFNSVTTRVDQISAAIHVWHLSPILGEGMRFYNLPQFITVTAPPNVFIDNLASTGIVGSLAFLFMVCVTVRTMFRLPYALGTLGLVILVFHYVDGLFDIFWIGRSTIAPFIIAGISLGMADMDRVRRGIGASEIDLRPRRSASPTTGRPGGGPRARPFVVGGAVAGVWSRDGRGRPVGRPEEGHGSRHSGTVSPRRFCSDRSDRRTTTYRLQRAPPRRPRRRGQHLHPGAPGRHGQRGRRRPRRRGPSRRRLRAARARRPAGQGRRPRGQAGPDRRHRVRHGRL